MRLLGFRRKPQEFQQWGDFVRHLCSVTSVTTVKVQPTFEPLRSVFTIVFTFRSRGRSGYYRTLGSFHNPNGSIFEAAEETIVRAWVMKENLEFQVSKARRVKVEYLEPTGRVWRQLKKVREMRKKGRLANGSQ